MEYADIQKIIDSMGNSNLTALDIEFPDGTKINMRKEYTNVVVEKTPIKEENTTPLPVANNAKTVKAPMVGTFYSKSSPKAEPYVNVGSQVKKGDVLCMIEAMKLMNEIESEWDGKIKEILVKDGEMVEYGKPLFIIE